MSFSSNEWRDAASVEPRKRVHVLFVCIGNICRSAMAEAMARKYGSDVLRVASAGLHPALLADPVTRAVLRERNIEFEKHTPRRLKDYDPSRYDLIVNLSNRDLGLNASVPVENWPIRDPYGRPDEEYRRARDQIEILVMRLILRARMGQIVPLRKSGRGVDAEPPGWRQ
ncbi:MAG TPA: low molecular weight phosphatase family protein [Bryobacteraceae bacterium]|nr:low molecular weight phosphatase family protein [Bryobacteraceae bacterium]